MCSTCCPGVDYIRPQLGANSIRRRKASSNVQNVVINNINISQRHSCHLHPSIHVCVQSRSVGATKTTNQPGLNKGVLKLAADWLQSCNNKVNLCKVSKGLRKPEGLNVTIPQPSSEFIHKGKWHERRKTKKTEGDAMKKQSSVKNIVKFIYKTHRKTRLCGTSHGRPTQQVGQKVVFSSAMLDIER